MFLGTNDGLYTGGGQPRYDGHRLGIQFLRVNKLMSVCLAYAGCTGSILSDECLRRPQKQTLLSMKQYKCQKVPLMSICEVDERCCSREVQEIKF